MCQLLCWHKAEGFTVVWKYILLNCVCVCAHRFARHKHTRTHTQMPGECFTVTTLLIALLLEKKKGIWCLLSKEKDGK